MPKSKKLKC